MANRLRSLRLARNLNINEVARAVGVVPSTYRAWELGAEIKGEPYLRLAELFEISLYELLTGQTDSRAAKISEIQRILNELKLEI